MKAALIVEMAAREIDALSFRGERTLSHTLALRALNEAIENCQRGRSGMGEAMRGDTK